MLETLDRAWIAARIPHQGSMCLLDNVVSWDETRIVCRSASHRAPDHPLRAHGRLGAACGIEYAAQAMAVHGALLAGAETAPRAGYLVSVRGVALEVERLDDIAGDLIVEANCIINQAGNVLYAFSIRAATATLLHGRAAVVLDAATLGNGEKT
jgi:predicted hotdog family 3-hydroxylacyl-ACP dehydratase